VGCLYYQVDGEAACGEFLMLPPEFLGLPPPFLQEQAQKRLCRLAMTCCWIRGVMRSMTFVKFYHK